MFHAFHIESPFNLHIWCFYVYYFVVYALHIMKSLTSTIFYNFPYDLVSSTYFLPHFFFIMMEFSVNSFNVPKIISTLKHTYTKHINISFMIHNENCSSTMWKFHKCICWSKPIKYYCKFHIQVVKNKN